MSRARSDWFWVLLSGLGVGWLVGMSVSPVLHIVVASIVACVAAVVSGLAGVKALSGVVNDSRSADDGKQTGAQTLSAQNDRTGMLVPARARSTVVDARPIGLLLLGIGAGSCFGIYARTNEWLGPDLNHVTSRWSKTGLSQAAIAQRVFERAYPLQTSFTDSRPQKPGATENVVEGPKLSPQTAGLFAFPVDDCQLLQGQTGRELADRLKVINQKEVSVLVSKCQADEPCLEAVRYAICANAH